MHFYFQITVFIVLQTFIELQLNDMMYSYIIQVNYIQLYGFIHNTNIL